MIQSPYDQAETEKRLTFNEDAANYDRWRPKYPKEVYEEIFRYSGAGAGSRALEIGIGTGQATEPFLKAGLSVTAVELGGNLADYSKEKFRAYSGLSVENTSFEAFKADEGSFGLIYSATAFHWIPEETGYNKAFRLLKKGGTLALWWNRPFAGRTDDELHQEIQKVYRRFFPEKPSPVEFNAAHSRKIQESILSHGFVNLKCGLYRAQRQFDAESYLKLLDTYSDHRHMAPDIKREFQSGIKNAILKHGNRLTLYDTVDLYLAGKPD